MTSAKTLATPVLGLERIDKTFGDLAALQDVSLDLAPGQIHALLGANGSGKSTLVKVMTGVYQPDGGSLRFDGSRLASFGSPAEAARRGVRVVHQEAPLIDTVSVTEAVALFRGFGTPALGPIPWARLRRQVQQLLDRMDVPVSANAQCSTVGPADRAGLALAIVAGDLFDTRADEPSSVRLLIVDEVTAAIHESETGRHLDRLRAIADMGVAVVMVTHRLGELRIADDVTVLRGGQVVYREAGGRRYSASELVGVMIGSDSAVLTDRPLDMPPVDPERARSLKRLWTIAPSRRPDRDGAGSVAGGTVRANAVTVADLRGADLVDCSFAARPGEVVGFAGLRGSGVEELPRILSGDVPWSEGTIEIGETQIIRRGDPRTMIDAGVTSLAADRLRAGGVASLTVEENTVLPALGRYWHKRSLRGRVVGSVIDAFDVRPGRADVRFGGLSGGNQQKVLLGKWLLLRPNVLVLGDPTYGVDPGARETIFEAVQDAAARGVCVLFFSTEPEQLVRICHRVHVLRNGRMAAELSGAELTLENVVEWSEQ